MRSTIRANVRAAGWFVALLCGGIASAGLAMAVLMALSMEQSSRTAAVIQNHMQGDMMHDALRGDVYAAVLAAEQGRLDALPAVKADVTAHADEFRAMISANRALEREAETLRLLAAVDDPLSTYIATAERIVGLAESDPAGANAALPQFDASWAALADSMGSVSDHLAERLQSTKAQADAFAVAGVTVMALLLLLGLGLSLLLIRAAGRVILAPLAALGEELEALASGRTDIELRSAARRDELGAIGRSVVELQQLIVTRTRTEAAERDQQRDAAEKARLAESERQALVVGNLADGLARLSRGDLTCAITADFPGEYAKLKTDFNAAVEQLRDAMVVVLGNISGIRNGTGEISQAADDLSRRTEQQAASLEETAAALDEITATVNRTASGARQAADTVKAAKGEAETSGVVVRDAVTAMGAIERSANEISQIIGVIDEIAFQTNLLALNAGVEAARAGEAGRGFAVVATEVRGLAQRSAEAAREIKALITSSTAQVGSGVALVGQTGEALQRIVDRVAEIYSLVTEISASAQEQATGLAQVNTAVNQMDQVTQQNAAMVEQTTAASHSLSREAEALAESMSRFNVGAAASRTPSSAAAASPMRAPARAVPARSAPVLQLRASGRGGAAPHVETALAGDGWEEF